MVLDVGISDMLSIAQTIGIIGTLLERPELARVINNVHENPTFGLKIQYPINWKKVETNISNENFTLLAYFHPAGKEDPTCNSTL